MSPVAVAFVKVVTAVKSVDRFVVVELAVVSVVCRLVFVSMSKLVAVDVVTVVVVSVVVVTQPVARRVPEKVSMKR